MTFTVATNHVFSGFAFVGFILVSILLPHHIRAKNIGTCAFIIWTSLLCFNAFLNSIIWNDNVINWAPVWCDISSRLMVGGGVSIQSACVCIARHLYLITSDLTIRWQDPCKTKRWRTIMCDYLIVVGIPLLFIALSSIFQTHRFYIYEEFGCFYALKNTQPSYPVFLVWPLVLSLIVTVYTGAIIRSMIQRKAHLNEFMQTNKQFCRLSALIAMILICSYMPIWSVVHGATEISSWPGWDPLHVNISQVVQFPISAEQVNGSQFNAALQFTRWVNVMYAVIFFAYFGFTEGAKRHYLRILYFATGRFDRLTMVEFRETRNERLANYLNATVLPVFTPIPLELSQQKVTIPTHPAPVLDIKSVLHRSSSVPLGNFDNPLSDIS